MNMILPRIDTAREYLVVTLKVAMTDEQARDVVDALEAYLEEGPGRAVLTFPNLKPDYQNEVKKLRDERDAAIELAERKRSSRSRGGRGD
jgi:hypothetical protein